MLMWETLSGQELMPEGQRHADLLALPHTLIVHSDNTATISIAKSGKNPTMRHMGRVHGVGIAAIAQLVESKDIDIGYIKSEQMAADIFTKFYPKDKLLIWQRHRALIGIFGPGEHTSSMAKPGGGGTSQRWSASRRATRTGE